MPGQHGHDLVRNAYRKVIAAARKHGKYVGVGGISDRNLIAEYVKWGGQVISMGSDLNMITSTGTARAKFVKELSDAA